MKYLQIAATLALVALCSCNSKQNAEQTDKTVQPTEQTEQASAPEAVVKEEQKAEVEEKVEEVKEKCPVCHDTREVTCQGCNGEGFIYTPNEAQGADWGRACFDCGGRGYGHKSGNDGNPLTLGKGKIPCPSCVNEIEVEVPQSTTKTILSTVPADLENKLVGKHNLRLQWISDSKFGAIEFTKVGDGKYECSGSQTGEGDDYLKVDGVMNVVNNNHLVFTGEIECKISHIHKGKKYIRKGVMDFVNNKNRKFWRLQQMDNGDCTDYVDIFIDKKK